MIKKNDLDFQIGDYCRVQLNPGSEKFLIAFSGANTPAGKFNYTKSLASLDVNKIFLNCRAQDYYHFGIPGLGSDIDQTIERLVELIAEHSIATPKIYTMGCSMGGYGALLYGALMKSDNIIAFGASVPEYSEFLCAREDRSLHVSQYRKLKNILLQSSSSKYLYYGDRTLADILSLQEFRKLKSTRLRFLPGYPHAVIAPISEQVSLSELIQLLLDSGLSSCDVFLPAANLPSCLEHDYTQLFDGEKPDGLSSTYDIVDVDLEGLHYTILYALGVVWTKKGCYEKSRVFLRKSLEKNFSARAYKRLLDIATSHEDFEYLIIAVQRAFSSEKISLFDESEFNLLKESYLYVCDWYRERINGEKNSDSLANGYYDRCFVDRVCGWCFNEDWDSVVEIFFNGVKIGESLCNKYRRDLDSESRNFGKCAFQFPVNLYDLFLSSNVKDQVATFKVVEKQTGLELVRSGAHAKVPLVYCHIDFISDGKVTGWVVSAIYRESRVALDLFVNDEFVCVVYPKIDRRDLEKKGYSKESGFAFDLREYGYDRGKYVCSLRLSGQNLKLKPDFVVFIR